MSEQDVLSNTILPAGSRGRGHKMVNVNSIAKCKQNTIYRKLQGGWTDRTEQLKQYDLIIRAGDITQSFSFKLKER